MKRNIDLEQKIIDFLHKWIRPIRIGDLRVELLKEQIAIPHSTLNSTIKRMQNEQIVHWEKYGPVSLTEEGQRVATHNQRHLHLVTMFLAKSLDLTHDEAQIESYRIAGILSCNLINKISQILNKPAKCICSATIPLVEDCIAKN